MSSSRNLQKSCDVKMADGAGASSSAPPATGEVAAHIAEFLSFRRELARCDAEGTVKPTRSVSPRYVVPVEALTPKVLHVCDIPSLLVGWLPWMCRRLMSKFSHRRVIVGLPAPSSTPAAEPKSRKRPSANPDAAKRKRCTEAGALPTKASGSGLSSGHRTKFVSLIDGMISECGSEVERLAKELEESRENSSQLEGK
ncbi:hypothetical protein F2Q70_00038616 [Brassica cretica]|uniref:Uncharacterized protein n=1 Tax=Brassica cretica TaxID=69181 RepID=A0A8S9KAT5_BRACR|nr:hypothetical protein F2Q70_00038616 [Brassica cretica]